MSKRIIRRFVEWGSRKIHSPLWWQLEERSIKPLENWFGDYTVKEVKIKEEWQSVRGGFSTIPGVICARIVCYQNIKSRIFEPHPPNFQERMFSHGMMPSWVLESSLIGKRRGKQAQFQKLASHKSKMFVYKFYECGHLQICRTNSSRFKVVWHDHIRFQYPRI